MKSRRGFTLIELLVTVAIIALLIAILLPSLQRAREEAKRVRCASNLHSIGVSLFSYGSQNQTYLPNRQYWWDRRWVHTDGSYFNLHWPEALYVDGVVAQDALKAGHYPAQGVGIFRCPSADKQFHNGGGMSRSEVGYGMGFNGAASSWPVVRPSDGAVIMDWAFTSASTTRLQARAVLATEGWSELARTSSGRPPAISQYGVYRRHRGGANYLMGDGHVEWSDQYHKHNGAMLPGSRLPSPLTWFHHQDDYGR